MSKSLKLSPKQHAAIQVLEQQKQQLNAAIQEANNKLNLIAELAFEAAGIDVATIENLKLEGDSILYDEKEAEAKKPSKKKAVTAVAE